MAVLPPRPATNLPNVPNAGNNALAASGYNLDNYFASGGNLADVGLGGSNYGSTQPLPNYGSTQPLPPAPQTQPAQPGERDSLIASLLKLITPNDEENRAIADIDTLDASYRTGNQNIQDKTIAMDFITGQQQSLENRYLNNRETLEQKASRLQAKRQIALDATKFALDREDKKVSEANANTKPFEVSPGSSVVKKNADGSYSTVFAAPAKPADVKTGVQEVNGRKLLINMETGETISDLGSATDASKPMSGDQAKVYSIATTIVPEISKLKAALQSNYRGSITGIITGTNRELVKLVEQVADKVGRLRSGGAINVDEAARFKNQIVSKMDLAFGTSQGALNALDGILTEANSVASNIRPQNSGSVDISQMTW